MKPLQTLRHHVSGAIARGETVAIVGKECPHAYAQRRANETGKQYIVTGMGHVWVKVGNEGATEQCGTTIIATYRPQR